MSSKGKASTSESASEPTATANVPRSGLPPFPPFDPLGDHSSLGLRWRKWINRFSNLLISLREFDPLVRRGMLLTYVGEATNDIFDTLPNTGEDYESAVRSLTEYFDPSRNKDMDIFEFRQIQQESGETLLNFYRRLRERASLCEFANADAEIKTQIIHKTTDSRLRHKALRERMDLKALLDYGNTLERSDFDAKLLEGNRNAHATNFIKSKSPQIHKNFKGPRKERKEHEVTPKPQKCRNCGGPFPHAGGKTSCPAKGVECHKCGKIGHFAKHCLSTRKQRDTRRDVHVLSASETTYLNDTDDEFIYTINASTKQPETIVDVAGVQIKVIVDTGSSVNLLNSASFERITQAVPSIQLQSTKTKVFPYGAEQPMQLLGQFTAEIKSGSTTINTTFLVTKASGKCLLSYDTSMALGLLEVNVNSVSLHHNDPAITAILHKHKVLFEGTGNLKDKEVKLEIDPNFQPVAQHPRRIPHSMRKGVNAKLQEMREEGIIERVEGATPWLSPLIAIPKKAGDLRLVLDMRLPNQALTRRRVQFPSVDEILHMMEGATVFSEVDLSQGYLQITLAEESRYITAFSTPDDGPHRFKRLIMGAGPSGEYFHEIIHQVIRNVPNCQNISDNIWLWSKDMDKHAKLLEQLLQTLEESGLTVKLPKCSFAVPQVNVFGHIVSGRGIQPDNRKVEAVVNAPAPKSSSEVRSFLGLVNYCSRYIPEYSNLSYPLRQLTKESVTFHWGDDEERSFQSLKKALANAPVLAHYSLSAPTRLVVDASPWALGAVLLQQQSDTTFRPVAYGSRSLTETEMKYAHIEKEALAIVFGCEHFHQYLYGRRFVLETDHRPLEHIAKPKPTLKGKTPPARVERWLLRLQEYDFEVIYSPGSTNLADPLSRLPTKTATTCNMRSNMETCADRFVYYLAEQLTPTAMTTDEIREASKDDAELIQVRQCIIDNQSHKLPQGYKGIANELSITEDIVLRGRRIVLPTSLRSKAISVAHEDHAGMTRCKQRIRSKLWWPLMDQEIERHVKSCHPCQVTGRPEHPEPLCPTELPKERWTKLSIDVCGPFPTGESVVILTDYYSRWPEAKILRTVTSKNILQWLDNVFATHGYPESITSDNASYFTSVEYRETLKSWGIKAKTVTEYWPQANGQVERFNQVLLKHVLTANVEKKDWRETLPTMLRNYHSTPHRITGETPAKLLLQREVRTKLPSLPDDSKQTEEESKVRSTDAEAKQRSKQYVDSKRKATKKEFKPGEFVLIQQRHHNKYSTRFRPDPLRIVKVNGSQVVLKDSNGTTYRRNSSHIKRFYEKHTDEEALDTAIPQQPTATPSAAVDAPLQDQDQGPDADPDPDPDPDAEPVLMPPMLRRSQRQRHPPAYLQDYAV